MDDGAATAAESVCLLRASREQNIGTVVATPHFYAGQETVEQFLERRDAALKRLRCAWEAANEPEDSVRIVTGAEVLVRENISHTDLRGLCIGDTPYILLELPFGFIPKWLHEEVENIVFGQGLLPIMAHVDRYMPWYDTERIGEMLDFPDLVAQINAQTVIDRRGERDLFRWLPPVERLVIGSDMHNTTDRGQTIGAAVKRLHHSSRGRRWLSLIEQSQSLILE